MKMMTIASGSSGNCTYVGSENTGILVDVGVSKKKILDAITGRRPDVSGHQRHRDYA
mgnify:CR=1 FL=1